MSKYTGQTDYNHKLPLKTGVLLTNLGTPDAPTPKALKKYLREFLSDPRVIEVPKPIWWLFLNLILLNTRPKKSAEAYEKVWTENGSPLMIYSQNMAAAMEKELSQRFGDIKVVLGMRYGQPSMESALEELTAANVRKVLVFPLYPQYSATTTASTFDKLAEIMAKLRWQQEIRMISHYHDEPVYIDALVESIRRFRAEHGKAEKLMFSFHGIPKDYFEKGDPYHCECQKTARLVVEQLALEEHEYAVTFQSRLGPREWLKPYTDETLMEWGNSGVKSVQVICAGFPADCLETIEEINMQNREFFLEAGGREYAYIPALNDSEDHIQALSDIAARHMQGWV